MFGWFAITEIGESHSDLERDGVGFVLEHTIKMVKVGPQGASPSIINVLRSLFDLTGG